MATLTITTTAKNTILDAFDNLLNTTGAGTAVFQLLTAANSVAASMNCNNPVFNTAASGQMALNTSSAVTTSNATGNASPVTKFRITDRAGTYQLEGDVATDGSGSLNLNSVNITSGDTVTISSFTLVA